jgi:hypothetical protein
MDKLINDLKKKPTGGFPPLYTCNHLETKKEKEDKTRGFATRGFTKDEKKMIADIELIMKERSTAPKPFIEL